MFVYRAPCQHTLALLQSRAERGWVGQNGWEKGWCWHSVSLLSLWKALQTQQEPNEAQNCPLDFPLRRKLKKPVSHAGSGQENEMDRGRQKDTVSITRENVRGCFAYSREPMTCINWRSLCFILGPSVRKTEQDFLLLQSPLSLHQYVPLQQGGDSTKWSCGVCKAWT